MRLALFCHSILSDWNHGNAHFLRGVVTELMARGHEVRLFEPIDGWSYRHLVEEEGTAPLERVAAAYPQLRPYRYHLDGLDLDEALDGVDVVLVHEWNHPALVARVGAWRAAHPHARLLFHDTHHRAATDPVALGRYDLHHYDGVLAFGRVVRDLYVQRGWARRAWVWHEAADPRVFRPHHDVERSGDLVWIGNWGDEERSEELAEFLVEPAATLRLEATAYGVRYPEAARARLAAAGIVYRGWVANFDVPRLFAAHRVTVHVPRRPYVRALPGIPTIRPFEALACGIPLVTAPWHDVEGLFSPGVDFLVARDGAQMVAHLRMLLGEPGFAAELAATGRRTVLARHTCAHRVDELAVILGDLDVALPTAVVARESSVPRGREATP